MTNRLSGSPGRTSPGCAISPISSRACERGTKSCEVRHEPARVDLDEAIERLEGLRSIAKDVTSDCGDNSCLFAAEKKGMRTNGGCRCFEQCITDNEARRNLARLAQLLRLVRKT